MIKKLKTLLINKCADLLNSNLDYFLQNLNQRKENKDLLNNLIHALLSDSSYKSKIVEDPRFCEAVSESRFALDYLLTHEGVITAAKKSDDLVKDVFEDSECLKNITSSERALEYVANSRDIVLTLQNNENAILAICNDRQVREKLITNQSFINSFLSDSRLIKILEDDDSILTKLFAGTEWNKLVANHPLIVREVCLAEPAQEILLNSPSTIKNYFSDKRIFNHAIKHETFISQLFSRKEVLELISSSERLYSQLLNRDDFIEQIISNRKILKNILNTGETRNLLANEMQLDIVNLFYSLPRSLTIESKLNDLFANSSETKRFVTDKRFISVLTEHHEYCFEQLIANLNVTIKEVFVEKVVEQSWLLEALVNKESVVKLIFENKQISTFLAELSSHKWESLLRDSRLVNQLSSMELIRSEVVQNVCFGDFLMTTFNFEEKFNLIIELICLNPELLEKLLKDHKVQDMLFSDTNFYSNFISDGGVIQKIGESLSEMDNASTQLEYDKSVNLELEPLFWQTLAKIFKEVSSHPNLVTSNKTMLLKTIESSDFLKFIGTNGFLRKQLFENTYFNDLALGNVTEAVVFEEPNLLVLKGWYMPQIPGDLIKLFDDKGKHIGLAEGQIMRPDLFAKYPIFTEIRSGFNATFELSNNTKSVRIEVWRKENVVMSVTKEITFSKEKPEQSQKQHLSIAPSTSIDWKNLSEIEVRLNEKTLCKTTLFAEQDNWITKDQLLNFAKRATLAEFASQLSVLVRKENNEYIELKEKHISKIKADDIALLCDEEISKIMHCCSKDSEFYLSYLKGNKKRIIDDFHAIFPILNSNSNFLDIGGNPPLLAGLLSSKINSNIYVADPQTFIFEDYYTNKNINAIQLDLLSKDVAIDEMKGKFNFISMCEVFEHLTGDLIETITKVIDLLEDDGLLYITTPNLSSISGIMSVAEGRSGIPSKDNETVFDQYQKFKNYGYYGHVREYTSLEIISFFNNFGMELIANKTSPDYRERHTQDPFTKLGKAIEFVLPEYGLFGKYLFKKIKDY